MEQWILMQKSVDLKEWASALNVDPLVAKIIRNRGITELSEARSFLCGTMEELHSPGLLKDMDELTRALEEAIAAGRKIRVIGDYDVDGVTSTYILVRGLELLGAQVDAAIPHRVRDGYGLNPDMVTQAAADGTQVILTCDNGISAMDAAERAAELGLELLVTDHHEVPYRQEEDGSRTQLLPKARAVVDPHRADCPYPFKEICGAMVAYKVMTQMRERTGSEALGGAMDELLQFAALGTVCDVMPLLNENRIVVREGIERMKHTGNPGLKALMEANALDPSRLSCYHLGFVLGPCVNATGRLGTAMDALDLFRERNYRQAILMASQIKGLNDSRKDMTQKGVDEALVYAKEHHLEEQAVWVIFLPEVHESIAGIIAGKVRESSSHPVFILTRGAEGIKGSGRSIEAYPMYDRMSEVKELFTKYGGHAQAAGLSMREEDIETLRRELNARAGLTEDDFRSMVYIDAAMPFGYATMELARELERLEPTGTGNPQPLFAQKNVTFLGLKRFGSRGQYGRFRVAGPDGDRAELTCFLDLDRFGSYVEEKCGAGSMEALEQGRGSAVLSITYRLSLNTYRGETSLQFVMAGYC